MTYNSAMLDLIDARFRALHREFTFMGSVQEYTAGSARAMVVFDGSPLAVPVKVMGNVDLAGGDRVGMLRIGSEFVVVGTFNTAPGPFYAARQSVAQGIPHGTWTPLTMDTVEVDSHDGWQPDRPSIYVPPQEGFYEVHVTVTWTPNADGRRWLAVGRNTSDRVARVNQYPLTVTEVDQHTSAVVWCNGTTDELYVTVFQDILSTLNTGPTVEAPGTNPRITVRYVRSGAPA